MIQLHTWGGEYFGYLDGEDLWTQDGRHVGRIFNDEIYSSNGCYLGEVINQRLIVNIQKKGHRAYLFSPYGNRAGVASLANHAGLAMYAGHEDFPLI